MDDEDYILDKPIVLPEVTLVQGFKVICSDPKCEPRVGFEPTEAQAEEKKRIHLEAHRKHEESMRARLAELTMEEDGTDVGPLPGLHCPSSLCHVAVGFPHTQQCDIAVCLSTGAQRVMRDHIPANDPSHECGNDVWTGFYSGEREALGYGVPLRVLKSLGYWDEAKLQWVLREDWEKEMHNRGLGPRISGM